MKNGIDFEKMREFRDTLFYIQHNTLACIEELEKIPGNGNGFGLNGAHEGNIKRLVDEIKNEKITTRDNIDKLLYYLKEQKLIKPQTI